MAAPASVPSTRRPGSRAPAAARPAVAHRVARRQAAPGVGCRVAGAAVLPRLLSSSNWRRLVQRVGGRILDFADHEGARDLVVPALLSRVERSPDEPDVQTDPADHVADESTDRAADADVPTGRRVDDMEPEHALAQGPAELGPQDDEVRELDDQPDQLEITDVAEERAFARRQIG